MMQKPLTHNFRIEMNSQNQNSLLVTRQIDNSSPGAVTMGRLVPSSHKRCEARNHMPFQQRKLANLGALIPVPGSLRTCRVNRIL